MSYILKPGAEFLKLEVVRNTHFLMCQVSGNRDVCQQGHSRSEAPHRDTHQDGQLKGRVRVRDDGHVDIEYQHRDDEDEEQYRESS